MVRKLQLSLAGLSLLLATILLLPSTAYADIGVCQDDESGGVLGMSGSQKNDLLAQTFTQSGNANLDSIVVALVKQNSTPNYTFRVSLRATTGGTPNGDNTTGADLANEQKTTSVLSTSTPNIVCATLESETSLRFDMGDYALTDGTVYAVVLSRLGNDDANTLRWAEHDDPPDIYADGSAWRYSGSWANTPTDHDFAFGLITSAAAPTPTPTSAPTPNPTPGVAIDCTFDNPGVGNQGFAIGLFNPDQFLAQTYTTPSVGTMSIDFIVLNLNRGVTISHSDYDVQIVGVATGNIDRDTVYASGSYHGFGAPPPYKNTIDLDTSYFDFDCEEPDIYGPLDGDPLESSFGRPMSFVIVPPFTPTNGQEFAILLERKDNRQSTIVWQSKPNNQLSQGSAYQSDAAGVVAIVQPAYDFDFALFGECDGCATPTPTPTPTATPPPTATPTLTPTPTPIFQGRQCLDGILHNQNEFVISDASGTNDYYLGQSFSYGLDFDLSHILLNLRRDATATDDLILNVWDTVGGIPDGDALATVTKDASDLPSSYTSVVDVIGECVYFDEEPDYEAISFEFTTPIRLDEDTTYFFSLGKATDWPDEIAWSFGGDNYANGLYFESPDGGDTWNGNASRDWDFLLMGTNRAITPPVDESGFLVGNDVIEILANLLRLGENNDGLFTFAILLLGALGIWAIVTGAPGLVTLGIVGLGGMAMILKGYLPDYTAIGVVIVAGIIALFFGRNRGVSEDG